ncbi:MAG: hypothetical protein QW057_06195 [Candidatus Bathyarchaeia archaeon]
MFKAPVGLVAEMSLSRPKDNLVFVGSYSFRFQVNASGDYYEPGELAASREGLRMLVEARGLLHGRRGVEGSLRVEFRRTATGLTWRAQAEGLSRIEGVRFSVSGLPEGRVVVPTPGGTIFTPEEETSFSASTAAGEGRPSGVLLSSSWRPRGGRSSSMGRSIHRV